MTEVIVRFDLKFSERAVRLALVGAMVLAAAPELASESVTLTTYYPAPSGVYTQIIGTSNSYMARDTGILDVGTSAAQVGSTKLVVMNGPVGIGTTNPGAVAGSAFAIDTAGTGGQGTAFDIASRSILRATAASRCSTAAATPGTKAFGATTAWSAFSASRRSLSTSSRAGTSAWATRT
jgi:hypothetical protein